jgi:divalent metal cation (Fe/Co/Zn/Cd) transporter
MSTTAPARNWTRLALWLVGVTALYNSAEAALAIWSGLRAHSIALLGFGLDSIIELAAASVLLWRLRVEARGAAGEAGEAAERKVHRFVGITFFALAAYVVVTSVRTLLGGQEPAASVVGIVLAAASLVVMPAIAWGKFRAANGLGSAALRAEAKETLACSFLSLTLLVGLAANALFGWGWADPVAALLMVPWLVKEGLEGVRGDDDD